MDEMNQTDFERVRRFRKAFPEMPFLKAFTDEEVVRTLNFMKASKQRVDRTINRLIERKIRNVEY
jgi:NCAIR mutase (PurE)-related protein